MKAFLGLGNPGKKYELTRHNFGFMVLNEVAKRHSMDFRSGKGEYLQSIASDKSFALFKPMTYMNNSGTATRDIARWYNLEPEDFIIIADDLDIPFGSLKIKPFGSSGGHNGISSIILHLQSDQIPRIKLGIHDDKRRFYNAENFVLSKFSKEDTDVLNATIQKAADAIDLLMQKDLHEVMNKYNQKTINKTEAKQLEG